jgi:integrase
MSEAPKTLDDLRLAFERDKRLKDSSLSKYRRQLRLWDARIGTTIEAHLAYTTKDMGAYLDELAGRFSQRTVRWMMSIIRSWDTWLYEECLIPRQRWSRRLARAYPVDQEAITRANGVREALTLSEASDMVAWCRKRGGVRGLAPLLGLLGGMRSAEIADMRPADWMRDHDGRHWLRVRKGKGGKTRRVEIKHPDLIEAWAEARKARGKRGSQRMLGNGVTARSVQRWAKEALTAVGRKELASHDLRRSFVTLSMEVGADLDALRRHCGHTNMETTLRCYVVRELKLPAIPTRENANVVQLAVMSPNPSMCVTDNKDQKTTPKPQVVWRA